MNGMADLIICLWLFPVTLQIFIPLILLAVWPFVRVFKAHQQVQTQDSAIEEKSGTVYDNV